MIRLDQILVPVVRERRHRGLKRQGQAREVERTARRSAVVFARWMRRRHGSRVSDIAARLSVSASVLSNWLRRWKENQMTLRSRGRPGEEMDRGMRSDVLSVCSLLGLHTTLTTLRDLFPGTSRGALDSLLVRCRRWWRRSGRWPVKMLRWTEPGRVWAMDFTEAPTSIDGEYRYLLLICDLASRKQLVALPCTEQSSELVVNALRDAFRRYGAPLVLKMDNGSPFSAGATKALLAKHGVFALYSPPCTPRYNGSVEAGIGALEVRAFYESARHGRPGEWTSDDVAAARLQANTIHRAGAMRPTPDEAWEARPPISDLESHRFRQAYDRGYQRACEERDHAPSTSHWQRAQLDRVALTYALVERGLLFIRTRLVTPPITLRSATRIS